MNAPAKFTAPRVVDVRCDYCGGRGSVPATHPGDTLATIEPCAACAGTGHIAWETSARDYGGPAFPIAEVYDGMTLRDYFAAKALQGMCANGNPVCWPPNAEGCYEFADAMLAERAK